jgi:hypothetical protein
VEASPSTSEHVMGGYMVQEEAHGEVVAAGGAPVRRS